jgi:hypothetical protein
VEKELVWKEVVLRARITITFTGTENIPVPNFIASVLLICFTKPNLSL